MPLSEKEQGAVGSLSFQNTGIPTDIPKSLPADPITLKLKEEAIESVNLYLIKLLETKDFCKAQFIGEALQRLIY